MAHLLESLAERFISILLPRIFKLPHHDYEFIEINFILLLLIGRLKNLIDMTTSWVVAKGSHSGWKINAAYFTSAVEIKHVESAP